MAYQAAGDRKAAWRHLWNAWQHLKNMVYLWRRSGRKQIIIAWRAYRASASSSIFIITPYHQTRTQTDLSSSIGRHRGNLCATWARTAHGAHQNIGAPSRGINERAVASSTRNIKKSLSCARIEQASCAHRTRESRHNIDIVADAKSAKMSRISSKRIAVWRHQ